MVRRRLTYANVVSSLALFIALGGTGYAAIKLPRNSVGNKQLKSNSVTSAKIRARGVQRSDLAPSARIGSRGARGPSGPAGPLGPSETIQVKQLQAVKIPSGAHGSATLVSVTLGPGAWVIDAQTTAFYSVAGGGSEFIDCSLQTASGETLATAAVRVGNDASGTEAGVIPVRAATDLAVATLVRFVCAHPSAIQAEPSAERTRVLATRVGKLENR